MQNEVVLVIVVLYGCETMVWREKERSTIKADQMGNLRVLLGVRRMNRM